MTAGYGGRKEKHTITCKFRGGVLAAAWHRLIHSVCFAGSCRRKIRPRQEAWEISLMALEALNSPRLASPVPPLLEDSSRFHGVEHWTKGKRSKCSRSDYHHQNVTEEEYLAFCLMLLGCDGNRQLFPLPRVTVVVAEKSSLSYKCSVCDKSLSNIIEAEICILL
ncbi:hypothetical protein Bca52824_022564 [Brassica carinata]|uniref:Uncharacterized protein n=1 Tax=Brassica carinata TaxID=52824 RepID=A0A8X8AUL8_BRACI|nr:hypothetical protein Bca52824_022564 [Brassica carinata]